VLSSWAYKRSAGTAGLQRQLHEGLEAEIAKVLSYAVNWAMGKIAASR
jgi:hypothetical protein